MSCASDKELQASGVELLVAGFANRVCAAELEGKQCVAKRYTDLVFLRIDRSAIGAVDEQAGHHGLGPRIFHSSEKGLVMERLPGRDLSEADMHKGDFPLLDCVAKALARFHSLAIPEACKGEPMLWRTVEKMMRVVECRPELVPDELPSLEMLRTEIAFARTALDAQKPGIVLGHNDFKPSNVMLTGEAPYAVTLIDFELGGPNYRGFDLFKLFRTALPFSDASLEHFLCTYAKNSGIRDVAALSAETRRFEPLTWLEALVFFLAMLQFKPLEAERWQKLAVDRWEKYVATKGKLLA
jgi:thiamine kinase-like enzyme